VGQSAQGAVGELLRHYRLDRGLTQEALAERAGISPRGVQTMESGAHLPFPATLRRVAVALGLAEAEYEALALAAQRSRRQAGSTSPRDTRAG
jgi:transcriptional regulator with XRE-family HTH domain